MHDKTTEYEETLRQAYEALGKAFEASLQEFKTRLMEADFALTAAMNHRLGVLRGDKTEEEKTEEEKTEPKTVEPTVAKPPVVKLDELQTAETSSQAICTYPECQCAVQVPIGTLPQLSQCPKAQEIINAQTG